VVNASVAACNPSRMQLCHVGSVGWCRPRQAPMCAMHWRKGVSAPCKALHARGGMAAFLLSPRSYGMAIMSRKVPCLVCNACRVVSAAVAVRWLEPAWTAHVVPPLAAGQPWAQAPHLLNASGLPIATASVCAKQQALEQHAAHRGVDRCS
jgi:hypothetical protein